jgi:hypothetical protein
MHHFYDVNVPTMMILLAACVQVGGEPYNKLFTTTEDGHLMAETRMVYQ